LVTRVPQNPPRPGRDNGARSRAPGSRFGRDRRRALIVCAVLAVVLGLSVAIGSQFDLMSSSTAPSDQDRGPQLAKGPVIVVPRSGNDCHQREIDNATWRIRELGTIDCDTAFGTGVEAIPREGAPSRVDVIRNGFRKN
jgi:hypothetical protein